MMDCLSTPRPRCNRRRRQQIVHGSSHTGVLSFGTFGARGAEGEEERVCSAKRWVIQRYLELKQQQQKQHLLKSEHQRRSDDQS
uniref:Uncharacterized protein n=1 Tax=Globodera rostochiensis TaxID=31243 RepID=A0A914I7C3_GLORO